MWDPYGLTNKKHKRLTKLVKETLRSYRFILWKGGESNEQSWQWSLCGKYAYKARNGTVVSALPLVLNH